MFYRDVFGGWRWEHTNADGTTKESTTSYDTREECVAAAIACGVAAEETAGRSAELDAFAGRSILCACPDVSRHSFLRAAVRPADTVIVVRGDQALKALHNAIFDAYVLDYWLPDWSGASFSREIRKSDPHVPIVFFSKASSDDAKRRALRAGADAFLTTPDDETALRRRLLSLISGRDRAKLLAEQAAKEALALEVDSRLATFAPPPAAPPTFVTAIERRARSRALEAFITSGGTRADFERTWTVLFSSAEKSMRLASQQS